VIIFRYQGERKDLQGDMMDQHVDNELTILFFTIACTSVVIFDVITSLVSIEYGVYGCES
jgi:hypothetical protein